METISVHIELSARPKTDGRHFILLRFSKGRKQKIRVTTGIQVLKKDFSTKAKHGSWVKSSDSQYSQKNRILTDILHKAESSKYLIERDGKVPTINNMIEQVKGDGRDTNFIHYYQKVVTNFKTIQHASMYRKYLVCFEKLKRYLKNRDVDFADIDEQFLKDYEVFHLKKGNAHNTIAKDLSVLKAVYNRGVKDKLISERNSPFYFYKIRYTKSYRDKLSMDEIKKIEELELPINTPIWHTRNMFLFSFYGAGIRWGDIVRMTWGDIKEGRLIYTMHKTLIMKSLKLFDPNLKILDYYKTEEKQADDFIFPVFDDKAKTDNNFEIQRKIGNGGAKANYLIKDIAKLAGIEKNISMHIARHSFANCALENHAGVHAIKGALGHSSLNITERYLKGFDSHAVDEVIEKVIRKTI